MAEYGIIHGSRDVDLILPQMARHTKLPLSFNEKFRVATDLASCTFGIENRFC